MFLKLFLIERNKIMKKGIVIEIFIPEEYHNGVMLDAMHSKKIGFKVLSGNDIFEIIESQNKENIKIYVDDIVKIKKIDNKFHIEKSDEDE